MQFRKVRTKILTARQIFPFPSKSFCVCRRLQKFLPVQTSNAVNRQLKSSGPRLASDRSGEISYLIQRVNIMNPKSRRSAQPLPPDTPTKFGPLSIHQNGIAVKHLTATLTPLIGRESHLAHSLENVRLSLHVERFDATERLSADIICITRFPEYGYEIKHVTPCEMRVGQTHGTAVVQSTCMCIDFENAHDTVLEVEYWLGEESISLVSIPIKFPALAAEDSDQD